jgi:P-type Cu2+ transporter
MAVHDPNGAGADHGRVTERLSPSRHRQHVPSDGHEAHGHGGHGDHAKQFRDRFWVSLALTLPVIAYSEMVQEWLRFTPPRFPGSE